MKRRKNLERAIVLGLLLSTSVYGSAWAEIPLDPITDNSDNDTYNQDVIVNGDRYSAIEIDNDTVSIKTENPINNEEGNIVLNSDRYGIRLNGDGSISLEAVGGNFITVTANSSNDEIGDGINVTDDAAGTITLTGASNTITVTGEHVDRIKRDILTLYRADIVKHADGYEIKVESIFDEIPAQLQKHKKKFKLSSIKKDARLRDYEDALFWLDDAMIVNICYNSTAPNIGLNLNMDRLTLKCYMADTGLLISHAFDENGLLSEEIYKKLLFGKLEVNEGMIIENIVAQMLTASGHKLYFYSTPSAKDNLERMEIDFLIAKSKISNRHNISPIEVKSSKNYTLSSLRKFTAKYAEQTYTPYVLHTQDYKEEEGIVYLPLYMAPLL